MAVSREYCAVMESVGEFVERQWAEFGPEIAGKKGFTATHISSVKMAHPAMPIFMYNLALLPAMSNGATVNIWGSADPVALAVLNVNHSQTRKSRLTSDAEAYTRAIDVAGSDTLKKIWDVKNTVLSASIAAKRRKVAAEAVAAHPAGPDGDGVGGGDGLPGIPEGLPFPGTFPVTFLGGTIERVRERCAGDFDVVKQVKTVQRLPGLNSHTIGDELPDLNVAERAIASQPGLIGRQWFGQALVYDEIYQFLQDLSLLDRPGEKKAVDGPGAGQTPLAGWFNRLLQTGKSDHETKSNGTHGGLDCPSVSVSLLGNFHPAPAIEMIRGERGDHGCQAKARLMFVTGLPVQPHAEYEGVGGVPVKMLWTPTEPDMLEAFGLEGADANVYVFQDSFGRPADDEEERPFDFDGPADVEESPDLATFVPDENGYEHKLPDGVWTRVRMRLTEGKYVLEVRIADRKVDMPVAFDISRRWESFVKLGKHMPHRVIEFSERARGVYLGYQTVFNIKVKQARDDGDVDQGAELGAAPWKLGMLSASLLMWDILWGDVTPHYREETWLVEISHVRRAQKLMTILQGIQSGLREKGAPDGQEDNTVAEAATDGDKDLAGCPVVEGAKTTEIVRRILSKGQPGSAPREYMTHTTRTFSLFSRKEKQDRHLTGFNVYKFRDICKAMPPALGRFDPEKDCFVFVLPILGSNDFSTALKATANTTLPVLQAKLTEGGRKGGHRRGSGARPSQI